MVIKEYIFSTGVRPFDHNPPAGMAFMKGFRDSGNGVYVIPFTCEEVPKDFHFKYASDVLEEETETKIRREILTGAMVSKYAYFLKL